jgi:hypothetical protein
MSYTSLWEIDKNWSGKKYTEYRNSHLFPPVVWDILMCKYIKPNERKDYDRIQTSYLCWLGWGLDHERANERHNMLNERINNSEIQYDRVLWEITNLSVFNAKDKEFVADCIENFITNNFVYYRSEDCEHIKERFKEIANDIRNLPKRCKYFVIHPTSCDDNVEWWFYRKRLSSWDNFVCEFTLIENNKVIGFSDNLEMCKGGADNGKVY